VWPSADFSGIPITERPIEERCRAVWVIKIEPGLVVACVIFEDGRDAKNIKQVVKQENFIYAWENLDPRRAQRSIERKRSTGDRTLAGRVGS
jgi:hypothetical protein